MGTVDHVVVGAAVGLRVDLRDRVAERLAARQAAVGSSVNEMATGISAAWAARVTPMASSAYVIVIAHTMSAAESLKLPIWVAW
jgi:hypothetical protein